MFLLKKAKADIEESIKLKGDEIFIEIYDDEFYSVCPYCGKKINLDLELIKSHLNKNGDFSSTSFFCKKCSKNINI